MTQSKPFLENIKHYQVLSKLGAGGMGEVYLAQDTKLDRKVALKILPADLATNQDRMRRFVQEAKAAAALNHPNIAHIYEIGRSPTVREGSADSDAEAVNFIAMEFIDGDTLREKIHRAKAPLPKLLKYLTQVAEGLSKAHSAGIVHRDLKPDNIMITRDDYAKILDFGLAKLVEPQGPGQKPDRQGGLQNGQDSSEIATAVMPQQSIPGMVMGTLGYMSPEQAQGRVKDIDHRSDIFSFGCILFEAATGRKAFEGKDVLDSLHKIVHAPTPQIRGFNATAPDELQRIVRRCLAKEPDKRYQSIKEVAIELEELQQELRGVEHPIQSSTSVGAELSGNAQAEAESTRSLMADTAATGTGRSTSSAEYLVTEIKRHKRGVLLVLAALVVVIGGVTFGLYKWIGQKKVVTPSRALKITRLTSTGKATQAAISPDGKYLVYAQNEAGQQSLWMAQVAVSSNVQIVPPADVNYRGITFSRDGNFIYYVRTDKDNPSGALYQAPVLGGNARKLLVNINGPVALAPDGKRLAFVRSDRSQHEEVLMVANADGIEERKLTTRKPPNSFAGFRLDWSPDGKIIAFGQVDAVGGLYRSVVGAWVADGKEQPITSQRWEGNFSPGIAWLSDGRGVLVTALEQAGGQAQIWFLAWPGDEVRRVTNDLNGYGDLTLTADSGALAAIRSEGVVNLWVDPEGDATLARQITSGTERYDGERGLAWTPNGKIVYHSDAGGNQNIWLIEADGTGNKQLSPNARRNRDVAVSPDGRYVVWESVRTGTGYNNIWRMDIDGGALKQLTQGVADYFPQVSPDGKRVVYIGRSKEGASTLWKVSIDGGDPVQLTDKSSILPVISPDGKLIAFISLDEASGQSKIAVIPFEGGTPVKIFDLPAGLPSSYIRFTPDGRAIASIRTSNGISNIWAQPLDGGEPKQLTDFKDQRIFNFAWSRDGKQLALARGVVNSDVVLISGFR